MSEHLLLLIPVFWLVVGWLMAGVMIRRVFWLRTMHRSVQVSRVPPRADGQTLAMRRTPGDMSDRNGSSDVGQEI